MGNSTVDLTMRLDQSIVDNQSLGQLLGLQNQTSSSLLDSTEKNSVVIQPLQEIKPFMF